MRLYDEPTPRTPWRVRIFRALVAMTILVLITVLVLVMMLPSFALMGLDHVLDEAAIQDRDVTVRTVTMRATYLGPLRFGDAAGELRIEEVQLDHSLDRWKPQPGPIRVLGLQATLRETDSGWQVDGLTDLMAWLAKQPPSDAPPPTLPRVQIRDATIDIISGDYQEQVQIEATATAIATNAYRVVADFAIRGNRVELAADVDVSSGTVSAKWRGTVAVGSLEDLLPVPATGLLQLSGDLQTAAWQPTLARVVLTESHLRTALDQATVAASELRGMAEVTSEDGTLALTHALLEGRLDQLSSGPWSAQGATVSAAIDAEALKLAITGLALNGPELAAKLDLEATTKMGEEPWPLSAQVAVYESDLQSWELPLTRIHIAGDSSAFEVSVPQLSVKRYADSAIRDFKANVTVDPLAIEFAAAARLIPLELLPAPVIGNEELYRAGLSGQAALGDDGWTFGARIDSVPQRVRVRIDDITASGQLALSASGSWGPTDSSGQVSVALLKPSMAAAEMLIACDAIGASATVADLRAPIAAVQSSIVGGELKLANDFSLSGAVLELPGTLSLEPELAAQGEIQLRVGAVEHGLARCESVDLRLPFAWSGDGFAASASGALTVTKPGWDTLSMRDLVAEIALQPTGVNATAKLRTSHSDLSFDLVQTTDWGKGLISETVLVMPRGDLGPLGDLLTEADMLPANLSGVGEGKAVIRFRDGVLTARAETAFSAVTVAMPEMELSATGISGSFAMADLLTMRGEPHQRLRFSGIQAAGLRLGEGEVSIHVESEQAVFLEDFWVKWCGGTLRTHAVRWDNENPDMNLELRAEKLQLGELAALTKSYGADGSGRLYGKLPLRYHRGKIELRPGFLYSIPGQEGRLSVSQAGMLTAGVPDTHPSYKNLKLAEAALRDFRYDYFRLEILDDESSSPLTLRMLGRAAEETGAPPFELEFNINTEGTTLDRLLNAGISLDRALNGGE